MGEPDGGLVTPTGAELEGPSGTDAVVEAIGGLPSGAEAAPVAEGDWFDATG